MKKKPIFEGWAALAGGKLFDVAEVIIVKQKRPAWGESLKVVVYEAPKKRLKKKATSKTKA